MSCENISGIDVMIVFHQHEKWFLPALKHPFKWGFMATSFSRNCSFKSGEGGFETLGFWPEQQKELSCLFFETGQDRG